ncbi:Permease of the drug/metabolite transporter (DMT) superfamily [Devosia crocina]|uniref:Permease of the drug/metabolite transporter (DMT) superfamily n=2 Tax=Devosia crocina TaxID=429728 RepID=A0A1I7NMA7_9HYPH|nr:Permease of the drug/metabolite transporter (DMT) superfamily [Devosia crocina]
MLRQRTLSSQPHRRRRRHHRIFMSAAVSPIESRANLGIALVLTSQIVLLMLDISAKWLSVEGMPTTEIVFVRYGMHLALLLLLFLPVSGARLFQTGNLKLEILRGACLLITTGLNFLAMKFLPLTVTAAIQFTSPLIICALSGPLLGDKVGWRRWLAIGCGFVGILIIVRPGSEAFQPAAFLSLACAFFLALFSILTRKLAGVDSAQTQQFFAGATPVILLLPVAFTDWVWPSQPISWVAFFVMGAAGLGGHFLNSVAHRFATPATLAPFSYLSLVYLSIASWLIFNEPPDEWFILGVGIIISSGLYIWLRERQLSRPVTGEVNLR